MADLPKNSSGLGGGSSSENGLGGGKGLGGTSGPGPERKDPPAFGPATFAESTNANWHQASLAMTAGIAETWFGDSLMPISVKERIKQLKLPKNFLEMDEVFLDELVPTGFQSNVSSFGEIQNLADSPLAQNVISYLNSRGVVALEHGLAQISSNSFINMNDLDGSKGVNDSLEPGGSNSTTWMGPWGTGFGSRFLQNFRVFKNDSGLETAVWFANAAFGTRPPVRDKDGGLDPQEVFRREILIPTLAKRLFYLAETPFPSSLAAMGRGIALKDLDQDLWPTPYVAVNDFELTVCTIDQPTGDPQSNFHIFPQVANFGWSFTASEPGELDIIVPAVIDALTVFMSILEDGFRNHRSLDNPYSWADFFSEFGDEIQGVERAATARWIPATQIGALVRISNELNNRGHRDSNEADFTWVAENGAGASTASAANSLVYGFLLPEGRLAESRDYLKAAISLDHFNESTNALANLGQVYLAAGEDDLAESTLLLALERSDKYSEGEASLFLGELYARRNEPKKAKVFFERAAASGHSEFAPTAESRLRGEAPAPQPATFETSSSTSTASAKFCVNCGDAFGSASQKFCGGCGTPR